MTAGGDADGYGRVRGRNRFAWNHAGDLADNSVSFPLKEGEPLSSTVRRIWYSPAEFGPTTRMIRPGLEISVTVAEPTTFSLLAVG